MRAPLPALALQDAWKGTFFIPRDVASASAITCQNSSDSIFRLLFFSLCKLYTPKKLILARNIFFFKKRKSPKP